MVRGSSSLIQVSEVLWVFHLFKNTKQWPSACYLQTRHVFESRRVFDIQKPNKPSERAFLFAQKLPKKVSAKRSFLIIIDWFEALWIIFYHAWGTWSTFCSCLSQTSSILSCRFSLSVRYGSITYNNRRRARIFQKSFVWLNAFDLVGGRLVESRLGEEIVQKINGFYFYF